MVMQREWVAFLLAVLAAGCASAPRERVPQSTIITSDKAHVAAWASGRPGLLFFTPSKADIARALPRVRLMLRAEAPALAGRIGEFDSQFFGAMVDGRKRLFCSFFLLDPKDGDPRSKVFLVRGGVDSGFQVEYDIESRQCLDLRINGRERARHGSE